MYTYSLSPEQSLIHEQGGLAADRLAEAIVETMEAVGAVEDVLVVDVDGAVAFMLELAR